MPSLPCANTLTVSSTATKWCPSIIAAQALRRRAKLSLWENETVTGGVQLCTGSVELVQSLYRSYSTVFRVYSSGSCRGPEGVSYSCSVCPRLAPRVRILPRECPRVPRLPVGCDTFVFVAWRCAVDVWVVLSHRLCGLRCSIAERLAVRMDHKHRAGRPHAHPFMIANINSWATTTTTTGKAHRTHTLLSASLH